MVRGLGDRGPSRGIAGIRVGSGMVLGLVVGGSKQMQVGRIVVEARLIGDRWWLEGFGG